MESPHSTVPCAAICGIHNQGLGNFAKQCRESIHAKFKPTW